ncbi:MAG TPA: DUF4157 domain-containing protein [Candidatus Dormibacteraeota bacterium]|nr:DUF4157 domain-containing protein [Candidatus Dormibacteraeota bacterium]
MEAHEYERLAVATRRAAERQRPAESSPRLTMPSAVLGLQRLAGNESVSALLAADEEKEARSPVHDVVGSGGGSPIEPGARSFLEERMGQDFSDVRIHTGGKADESARSISAQAYTVGTDVVFRSGAYQPDTPSGRHVLAHELAHVVQQKSGPVSGTPAPGGISISTPGDHFEQAAERTADMAMSGPAPSPVPAASGDGVTAQRAAEEEEEDVAQTLTAQRAEEEEEEPAG